MKTTIRLRDDLLRQVKARAALRGQSLSRYLEERLEQVLKEDEDGVSTVGAFLDGLPKVPKAAVQELDSVLEAEDFREIDSATIRTSAGQPG